MDWSKTNRETLDHLRALLRIDTTNPPGNETRAAEYLKSVADAEGKLRKPDERAKLFAKAIGAKIFAGRFVPGTMTNPNLSVYVEPSVLLVTDPAADIQALHEDRGGNLWIGTTSGLVVKEPSGAARAYRHRASDPRSQRVVKTESSLSVRWPREIWGRPG